MKKGMNPVTVEEQKKRAKDEKEHLAMVISLHSNQYTLNDLREMKLGKLREIAEKLSL